MVIRGLGPNSSPYRGPIGGGGNAEPCPGYSQGEWRTALKPSVHGTSIGVNSTASEGEPCADLACPQLLPLGVARNPRPRPAGQGPRRLLDPRLQHGPARRPTPFSRSAPSRRAPDLLRRRPLPCDDRARRAAEVCRRQPPRRHAAGIQGDREWRDRAFRQLRRRRRQTITFRIADQHLSEWDGTEQKRTFTLTGDTLTYSVGDASVGGGVATLVWRRAK